MSENVGTSLPFIDRSELEMRCAVIVIAEAQWKDVRTTLYSVREPAKEECEVKVRGAFIAPEHTSGLIPSKCARVEGVLHMLHYINDTLPVAVKKFLKGTVVLDVFVPYGESLIYNIEDQLLIDPQMGEDGVNYIIVCSVTTARSILNTDDWRALCGEFATEVQV